MHGAVKMRSRLESRIATIFDRLNIGWQYEPLDVALPGRAFYRPDFLIEPGVWVEAKGFFSEDDQRRFMDFIRWAWARRELVVLIMSDACGFVYDYRQPGRHIPLWGRPHIATWLWCIRCRAWGIGAWDVCSRCNNQISPGQPHLITPVVTKRGHVVDALGMTEEWLEKYFAITEAVIQTMGELESTIRRMDLLRAIQARCEADLRAIEAGCKASHLSDNDRRVLLEEAGELPNGTPDNSLYDHWVDDAIMDRVMDIVRSDWDCPWEHEMRRSNVYHDPREWLETEREMHAASREIH